MQTYSDFQAQAISEKIGLVQLEASKRLIGFTLHQGSVYKLPNFNHSVIVSLADQGTPYAPVDSIAAVVAGSYYNDRINRTLYIRTVNSVHPNSRFLALTFTLFFSNVPLIGPHDLDQGFDVEWLPLLRSSSQFGFALDNQNQLGQALEGGGTVTFENEQDFWKPIFDKVYFENQNVYIYSWNRELPFTEAKLIYRGKIEKRTYSFSSVQFQLKDVFKELRAQVPLDTLADVPDARLAKDQERVKQRRIYGFVRGHRPQNIDQVGEGYPMSGTVYIANGSQTLIGIGTQFQSALFQNDQVLIGDDTQAYTIAAVTSNTEATLSEPYQGRTLTAPTAVTMKQKPSIAKNWQNRRFLIAGHPLSQPSTFVTKGYSGAFFEVDDPSFFLAGDQLIMNQETVTVLRVSGNRITLANSLVLPPQAGDEVVRLPITAVRLDGKQLVFERDYTIDAENAILTLSPDAEFNTARVLALKGTLTFSASSPNVTGVGTFFRTEIEPGDYIKAASATEFRQVLSITDDTNLVLAANAPGAFTGLGNIKKNENYEEGRSVLTVDTYGVTGDGLTISPPLLKAPHIVRDLLNHIGIETSIDDQSFADASLISEERLGFVIPSAYTATSAPIARDVINEVNKSVLGALVLNEDLEFSYTIFSPGKKSAYLTLKEYDILKLEITSNSENLIKTAIVQYGSQEYDFDTSKQSYQTVSESSQNIEYLAGLTQEKTFNSYLTSETDARVLAGRLLFLNELASSIIKVATKLQTSQVQVTDALLIEHEKIYERFGSNSSRKIAIVQSAKKSIVDASLELEDLSNAFTRCGCIAEDGSVAYPDASESERMVNGYVTDEYGLQENDPETYGVSLIW